MKKTFLTFCLAVLIMPMTFANQESDEIVSAVKGTLNNDFTASEEADYYYSYNKEVTINAHVSALTQSQDKNFASESAVTGTFEYTDWNENFYAIDGQITLKSFYSKDENALWTSANDFAIDVTEAPIFEDRMIEGFAEIGNFYTDKYLFVDFDDLSALFEGKEYFVEAEAVVTSMGEQMNQWDDILIEGLELMFDAGILVASERDGVYYVTLQEDGAQINPSKLAPLVDYFILPDFMKDEIKEALETESDEIQEAWTMAMEYIDANFEITVQYGRLKTMEASFNFSMLEHGDLVEITVQELVNFSGEGQDIVFPATDKVVDISKIADAFVAMEEQWQAQYDDYEDYDYYYEEENMEAWGGEEYELPVINAEETSDDADTNDSGHTPITEKSIFDIYGK